MKMGIKLEATQSVSMLHFSNCCWRAVFAAKRHSRCPSVFPQIIDDKLIFVKVHMPWDMLCTYAEVLHIKLPIQPNDLSSRPSPWHFCNFITKHFYPSEDLIKKETEYFTAPFEKERLEFFHITDKDNFFTPSMRSRMVRTLSLVSRSGSVLADFSFFPGILPPEPRSLRDARQHKEVRHQQVAGQRRVQGCLPPPRRNTM